MFSIKRIVFTCAFLLAVILAWWFVDDTAEQSVDQQRSPQKAIAAVGVDDSQDSGPLEKTYDPQLPKSQDNCLAPWQIESLPTVVEEATRLQSLMVADQVIEPYRGLTWKEVESLAAQNDSAAMAVLGAMALLRAKGIEEGRAIDFLGFNDKTIRQELSRSADHANTETDLATAYDWFYRSALHGRLFALTYAGEVLYVQEPNPIKQGSISQSDYDALSDMQKAYLNTSNIYTAAAQDLAGNPDSGLLGMMSTAIVRSDPMNKRAADLAAKFISDQESAGLPGIVVPKSTMPPFEELVEMVCEEYRPN